MDDALRATVFGLLAAGSGVAIQWLYAFWLEQRPESDPPISRKDKHRATLLLSVLVPTALYSFAVLMQWVAYSAAEHIAYIVTAFTAQKITYGETKLPTAAQEAELKLEAMLEPVPPTLTQPPNEVHNAATGTYVLAIGSVLITAGLLVWAILTSAPGVCASCRATPTPIVLIATATPIPQATATPTLQAPTSTATPLTVPTDVPTVALPTAQSTAPPVGTSAPPIPTAVFTFTP